jgi:hypothetical protein
VVKHRDFAVELPKLNVVTVKQPFSPFHGLSVVGTMEGHRPVKMAVCSNEINVVFHHAISPVSELASRL